MSFATFGYRRGIPIQQMSKDVSLISGETFTIEAGQYLRIETKNNNLIEGFVACVLDEYFTICFNEKTCASICLLDTEFISITLLE